VRSRPTSVIVRPTEPHDFPAIADMGRALYPEMQPWSPELLAAHRRRFPEGQLVAVAPEDGRVLGMVASLVVLWDDYELDMDWRDFTAGGTFANHDPAGRTLYGADVMVRPDCQGRGVGKALYAARRALCRRLGLRRIRAGARLRGYHRHADTLSAAEYVRRVSLGRIGDPTLSFQLRQGFRVLGVVPGYLRNDPESLGWAAVIEWGNEEWRGEALGARVAAVPDGAHAGVALA